MTCQKKPHSACGACLSERRRNRRLSVRLGVSVRLPAAGGKPEAVERTATRNVSPGDACIESGLVQRLRPGDRLELDIDLPGEGATIFTGRRLQATGRVVRMELAEPPSVSGIIAVVFEGSPVFHSAER